MASSAIDSLLSDLRRGLEAMFEEAREEGRNEVREMLSGIVEAPVRRRRRGKASSASKPKSAPKAKAKAKAKGKAKKGESPWDRLTDDQYIERVNAIRIGRGMAPLTAAERAEKIAERHGGGKKKKRKRKKSAWDTYTPEQRKAHLEAMKAGRQKAAAKRRRKR